MLGRGSFRSLNLTPWSAMQWESVVDPFTSTHAVALPTPKTLLKASFLWWQVLLLLLSAL